MTEGKGKKSGWVAVTLAGFSAVVSLVGVVISYVWSDQSESDRKLQWQPALSVVARLGPLQDREPLGLFLENAGKGPARVDGVCESFPLPQAEIADLRAVLGKPTRGTLVAPGEVLPLLAYAPTSGKDWSNAPGGSVSQVNQVVEQLEAKKYEFSVCYRSLYKGCYRVRRSMVDGVWQEQRSERSCDATCCQTGKTSANESTPREEVAP